MGLWQRSGGRQLTVDQVDDLLNFVAILGVKKYQNVLASLAWASLRHTSTQTHTHTAAVSQHLLLDKEEENVLAF